MTEVQIELVGLGKVPTLGTDYAAAYDLYARDVFQVEDNLVVVHLGIKTGIPVGYRAVVHARSSISPTGWMLANGVGIIDSDYRGEWKAYFNRIDPTAEFPFKPGHRVAQFYLEEVTSIDLRVVDDLAPTARGGGGFGSTGK